MTGSPGKEQELESLHQPEEFRKGQKDTPRLTTSQGSRVGPCLALGNELSEETHVLMKQETLLGKVPGREP